MNVKSEIYFSYYVYCDEAHFSLNEVFKSNENWLSFFANRHKIYIVYTRYNGLKHWKPFKFRTNLTTAHIRVYALWENFFSCLHKQRLGVIKIYKAIYIGKKYFLDLYIIEILSI